MATRRHGTQLEDELLAAAWQELVEVGYGRLTMASIAARARTSEAVLYRRWTDKDALVLAALERQRGLHPVSIPDTGNLRDDLVAYLREVGDSLAGFYAVAAAAALSGLSAATGRTPAQVRDEIMAARSMPRVRTIYKRAHERGELDLARIPAVVLAMPFDLVRHDLLMFGSVKPARIRAIVDQLFLPLVGRAGRPEAGP